MFALLFDPFNICLIKSYIYIYKNSTSRSLLINHQWLLRAVVCLQGSDFTPQMRSFFTTTWRRRCPSKSSIWRSLEKWTWTSWNPGNCKVKIFPYFHLPHAAYDLFIIYSIYCSYADYGHIHIYFIYVALSSSTYYVLIALLAPFFFFGI